MKLLINEQQESYKNAKSAVFVRKGLKINKVKIKNIAQLEAAVIIQVNIEVLPIAYVI